MDKNALSSQNYDQYDPDRLLNTVSEKLKVPSDAALARELNIARRLVSAIRSRQTPVTGSLLLWMHQATGMHIAELRALMGDRRKRLRCARGWRTAQPR